MSLFYSIRHMTRFRYSHPVTESVMEVRKEPRTEGRQRCIEFRLTVNPAARVFSYRDHLLNSVHHFDVAARHRELHLAAEATVELRRAEALPGALDTTAWQELDAATAKGEFWDKSHPSRFARPSEALAGLARTLQVDRRRSDPLTMVRELNVRVHDHFEYVPKSTRVDSPIEEAITSGRGVCQDFTHIMIALVRGLGIPCRYVSGYLFRPGGSADRSLDGATHAWLEAWLPGLGWTGFDPTNNLIVEDRHIRTAVGRDYADVPPTRGIYKGDAVSELEVAVSVTPAEGRVPEDVTLPPFTDEWPEAPESAEETLPEGAQQQQQQQ